MLMISGLNEKKTFGVVIHTPEEVTFSINHPVDTAVVFFYISYMLYFSYYTNFIN